MLILVSGVKERRGKWIDLSSEENAQIVNAVRFLQSLENAYRQVECSRHGIADLVKFASFFVFASGEVCQYFNLRNTLLMLLQTFSCGFVCPEETIWEPKFSSFCKSKIQLFKSHTIDSISNFSHTLFQQDERVKRLN